MTATAFDNEEAFDVNVYYNYLVKKVIEIFDAVAPIFSTKQLRNLSVTIQNRYPFNS